MNFWINVIFYQATWLITVAGAARGWWWAGPLALAVFATWQLAVSSQRRADVLLLLFAAAIGFVIDSAFALTGLLTYSASVPWPQFAPIWIIALWMSFALTLNHSLAYLKTHLLLGAALGGIGAPLAYWAAGHAWGALTFPVMPWTTVALLAVVWALLTPALGRLAEYLCKQESSGLSLQGIAR